MEAIENLKKKIATAPEELLPVVDESLSIRELKRILATLKAELIKIDLERLSG
jgi:hypothetical protein